MCDRIGFKIGPALVPYQPISIGPVHSSDMPHFTISRRTGQSAGSARANRYRVAAPLVCWLKLRWSSKWTPCSFTVLSAIIAFSPRLICALGSSAAFTVIAWNLLGFDSIMFVSNHLMATFTSDVSVSTTSCSVSQHVDIVLSST